MKLYLSSFKKVVESLEQAVMKFLTNWWLAK